MMMMMWVLRILCGRMRGCVNLPDVVTLHVSVDCTGVCKSIVVPSVEALLPVTLGPVVLEQKDA